MLKLGALWRKQNEKGQFLMGTINESTNIIVYPNNKRQSDKSPEYYVYLSEKQKKPEQQQPPQQSFTPENNFGY